MGMPLSRQWTAAEVRAITREDRAWPRYELIDGELLVTPAPRAPHQFAALELALILAPYLDLTGVGFVLLSPADLELRPGTVTQPDVFVVPRSEEPSELPMEWSDIHSLLLAVEILSPSSLRTDRVIKRNFYLANGVAEYWVVDCDGQTIERWESLHDAPDLCRGRISWAPLNSEPLVIDLDAMFARIDYKFRRMQR